MNAEDFCYWLQGHFELSEAKTITEEQIKIIQNHLDLVFAFMENPVEDFGYVDCPAYGAVAKTPEDEIRYMC